MEKEFIPYEQALALKELDFNEPCYKFYDKIGLLQEHSVMDHYDIACCVAGECITERHPAPTFSQSFRWFRDEYKIRYTIRYDQENSKYHGFIPSNWIYVDALDFGPYKTYEEAEFECLKKLIEIVKNK
jgi:hypothetical protein